MHIGCVRKNGVDGMMVGKYVFGAPVVIGSRNVFLL